MNTRLMNQILRCAILASFACGATVNAQNFPVNSMPLSQSTMTVALLLPHTDSAFMPVAEAVAKGISAANSISDTPVNVVLLPRKQNQTALSHLQDAALNGAAVAIGPITRDEVNEIAQLEFLPLPVVSLNFPDKEFIASELMMNFSLSQEAEARQIVKIAVGALPLTNSKGELPKVAIFESQSPLENRIANIYAEELTALGLPFDRIVLTPELMAGAKLYEDQPLDPEEEMPELEELPDPKEDPYGYQRIRLRNKRIMDEFRAQQAVKEPPFFAAFLAMDARAAAMVRPRLPLMCRVWGTSMINPGDVTQSTAASLTYDLKNVGLVEAPLVLLNNKNDFKAYFGVEMPATLLERRLFAFGVDAYQLAKDWAHWKTNIEFVGTTGSLKFSHAEQSSVQREAQPTVILTNKVQARTVEQLQAPIERPE